MWGNAKNDGQFSFGGGQWNAARRAHENEVYIWTCTTHQNGNELLQKEGKNFSFQTGCKRTTLNSSVKICLDIVQSTYFVIILSGFQ